MTEPNKDTFWAGLQQTLKDALKPADPAGTPDPNATPDPAATPDPKPEATVDVAALTARLDAVEKTVSSEGELAKTMEALKKFFEETLSPALDGIIDRVGNLEKATALRKGLLETDDTAPKDDDPPETSLSKAFTRFVRGRKSGDSLELK